MSDFHKMTITVMKTDFVKSDPLKIHYRNYKNFNSYDFRTTLQVRLETIQNADSDNSKFEEVLCNTLEEFAPIEN